MQHALAKRRVGDYIIRQCVQEDLPKVISINLTTLPEHYSNQFFEEILKDLPEAFLVAELKGEVVGYIMCRIEYGFSHIKRWGLAKRGHIVSIAVLKEHRLKGLGRALLEEALDAFRRKGCTEAYLEVRVSNAEAIGLYRKLGFEIVSRLEGYYRDGEVAYLMSLAL